MKQITATDTLEDIWDTIAAEPEAIELTAEKKKIIDERLWAYHKKPLFRFSIERCLQKDLG